MKREDLLKKLKEHRPLKIYLGGEYYDTVYYNQNINIYQGAMGSIKLETIIKAISGKVTHISVE